MSHIEFGGYGTPTPDIIIPDPHVSDHLPTQVLELTEDFVKADWMDLGYTNYEVWCIGGAGGLGGGIFTDEDVHWASKDFLEAATTTVWNAHLAALQAGDAYLGKNFYTDYYTTIFSTTSLSMPHGYLHLAGPGSGYIGGYAYDVTHFQAEEYYNPSHLLPVVEYESEFTTQSGYAFGGAGGGGGLHVVSGLLEDLDDITTVVVGQAGTDAPPGQIHSNGLWTPSVPETLSWYYRSVVTPQSFNPPTAGGDGGTSSFGDIAQASGGKGGNSAVKWISGSLYIDGAGGEGGVGNRATAGGGGAGALPEEVVYSPTLRRTGQDGNWDGAIGQGGGGGRGGQSLPVSTGPTGPGFGL